MCAASRAGTRAGDPPLAEGACLAVVVSSAVEVAATPQWSRAWRASEVRVALGTSARTSFVCPARLAGDLPHESASGEDLPRESAPAGRAPLAVADCVLVPRRRAVRRGPCCWI